MRTPVAREEGAIDVSQLIRRGRIVVLATASPIGEPATTVVSWLVAKAPRAIALALDRRGRAFANIRANNRVSLELLGANLATALIGDVQVVKNEVESAPFPCAALLITVRQIRSHLVAGVDLRPPRYRYLDDNARYLDVEERVVEELATLDVTRIEAER